MSTTALGGTFTPITLTALPTITLANDPGNNLTKQQLFHTKW
ncbi:MAG: hypothetical protein QM734_15055 [Cyclobacteriaceae bacterium]